jgi:5-methyltetrahydrofolate--homocysteine methyltransferase
MAVETILEGKNGHIVTIGPDHPFAVIGERINPTGRKSLGPEFVAGDFSRAESDALAQVEAGAKVLDVNAGIPGADEPVILAQVIQAVQAVTDVPICIDTSTFEAIEPALKVVEGKALLNSVTGEDESLERILPLVKRYGCAVIGMANDDSGISMEMEDRFNAAKKIVEAALDHGIPREDVIIDPLAMPVGAATAAPAAGLTTFRIVKRVREELDVNLSCGASNISFGLPDRHGIDSAFLPMLMTIGVACSITNPLAAEVRRAILAADVLLDHDEYSMAWVSYFRAREAATAQA